MTNITAYRVFFVLTDCEQVDGAEFLLSRELGETVKEGSDGRFRPLNQAHYRYSIKINNPGDIFIFV